MHQPRVVKGRSAPPEARASGVLPLVRANGVTLQYKTPDHLVTATYRVSFDIFPAERYVILGPSGCGKSTILKAIAGFIKPVEGEFLLKSKPVTGPGPDRLMVFQEFDQLLPWKTVLGNVMFPMLENNIPRAEAEKRAREAITMVNLADFIDVYPHMLSGGMKQRCAIARAMAMKPDVLMMDEPYAALDALTRRKMQDELLQLWNDIRFTLVFVTHSIEEAVILGSRILVLSPHPGQVRAELNSPGFAYDARGGAAFQELVQKIHHMLFGDRAGKKLTEFEMSDTAIKVTPFVRAEYTREVQVPASIGEMERALPFAERLWNIDAVRRLFILLLLAVLWEVYGRWSDNPLLFPTFSDTMAAWWNGIVSGVIPARLAVTLRMLLMGYALGLALAALFVTFAISSRFGTDLLSTLTSMFNPLPAIALLPLALLWFGLGAPSIVFVIVHSVLWAVALNTHAGCAAVSDTLRMAGQTFGLKGFRYVVKILMPAAFPAILSGLKIGWAFAWRTLIAAELVFGVSSGKGGLGWYIFENRNMLDTANVFAGLLTVMAVGLLVEGVIFRTIEAKTVRRWGMQHA